MKMAVLINPNDDEIYMLMGFLFIIIILEINEFKI